MNKPEEPKPKPPSPNSNLSRMASTASLGGEDNPLTEQEDDPTYTGPKKDIKAGSKEFPDHYHIIGLGRDRYRATDKQIKDNYKILSLKLHPDKCGVANASEEEKEEIEGRFKSLQLAYEVLLDSKRRREYDSVDAAPTKLPTDFDFDDYFDVCIPAFEDLCMWYDGKGDPKKFIEADPEAPFEKVRKMYEFWAKFNSWREFPAKDEHDLETAEDRTHKRWMERENKRMRDEEKKQDTKKIKAFIEKAEANDPRVLKKRQEEKEAREAKRKAKGAGKKEAEEAARKKAEEEAAAAAAAAEAEKATKANAKKELEKQKKALRKEKARLREVAKHADGWVGAPSEEDIEELCGALQIVSLKSLCDSLEPTAAEDPGALVEGLLNALAGIESAKSEERRKAAEEAAARAAAAKGETPVATAPWDDEEELKLLDKACNQKFPMGTSERWERVSEYMCEHAPKKRTAKEVMTRYKAGL